MAELANVTRSALDQAAGRKAHPTTLNRVRSAILDSAAAYTAANGDTGASAIVIPAGSRILAPVVLSAAGSGAGITLSIGLRDAATKNPIDPTAVVNAASISGAGSAVVLTGTKTSNGQFYVLPQDAELYATVAGGTPNANAAWRAEIQFVSP